MNIIQVKKSVLLSSALNLFGKRLESIFKYELKDHESIYFFVHDEEKAYSTFKTTMLNLNVLCYLERNIQFKVVEVNDLPLKYKKEALKVALGDYSTNSLK